METNNTIKLEVVNKETISKNISRQLGLTIADVSRIIDIFQYEVEDAIKNNKKVQLNGFLILTPKNVKGKVIVSPLDKKEYAIEAHRSVEVKVGKEFRDYIKDGYRGEEDDTPEKPKRLRKSKK